MSQQPSPDSRQQFNIHDASIADSQIGGQAGHDLTQNHGSGAIYKDVTIYNYSDRPQPKKTWLSRQEYRNRQILLNKVKNYWVEGVLANSLHNRVLIELGLEERPNAVTHPWNLVDEEQKPLPQGTKAINLFDKLGDGRTLLILGEPGSGKTTTLLELTSDLITRAEQDTDRLIPVVLNLSSWAGRRQTIANWLVEELNTKYQVPQKVGQSWVKKQQLLLLFDGLDEVQAGYREACIAAVNAFHQEYNPEIVVCCRIKDYQILSNRLNFQRAVCLKSLTLGQVRHYLDRVGSELAGLRELLEENTALQELSQSPLMLNIMALAYQGVAAKDMPQTGLVYEYRQQLFKDYIKRMFQRRRTIQQYNQAQVMRWLIWLAQRMVKEFQTVFLIERMQPNWLSNNYQKITYQNGNIVISAIMGSLITGLLIGLSIGIISGFIIGLLTGLSIGIISGFIIGLLTVRSRGDIKTVESLKWSWLEAIEGINFYIKKGLRYGRNLGLIFSNVLSPLLFIFSIPR
ncbi:NACHT domain-containing protein [Allocoleopsis sp.]|uniref:NACHT domain-containing protein n=1 Tax=Allocoleopsis sp. TaxID=3088169 RepID=UPI002FD77263